MIQWRDSSALTHALPSFALAVQTLRVSLTLPLQLDDAQALHVGMSLLLNADVHCRPVGMLCCLLPYGINLS
ncbi:MAG: hypothetical protein ACPIOQ_02025, partial [Promethearchaeia archaeon]